MTVLVDLAIDPDSGDLMVDGTELVLVEGVDAIGQEIQTRLRWPSRDWFLDTSAGVPYFTELFEKGVSLETVRAVLKREIERAHGVIKVRTLEVAVDRVTRYCTIDHAEIETTDGTVTLDATGVGV